MTNDRPITFGHLQSVIADIKFKDRNISWEALARKVRKRIKRRQNRIAR